MAFPPSSETRTIFPGNAVFRITVDPARGAIQSLVDKRSGRELVDATAPHGFGQHLHERFSADDIAHCCKACVRGNRNWAFVELGKPNLPPAPRSPIKP